MATISKTYEGDVGRPLVGLLSEMKTLYDTALETHKGPPYIFYKTYKLNSNIK